MPSGTLRPDFNHLLQRQLHGQLARNNPPEEPLHPPELNHLGNNHAKSKALLAGAPSLLIITQKLIR